MTRLPCLAAFVFLLLAGCRSERVVFQFQPAAGPAAGIAQAGRADSSARATTAARSGLSATTRRAGKGRQPVSAASLASRTKAAAGTLSGLAAGRLARAAAGLLPGKGAVAKLTQRLARQSFIRQARQAAAPTERGFKGKALVFILLGLLAAVVSVVLLLASASSSSTAAASIGLLLLLLSPVLLIIGFNMAR